MFETIRKVGIFMICAQMIVHLKPNESYEKYLKLLMSVMVMVQIIFPIMQFLGSDWDGEDFADRVRAYGQSLQGEKSGTDITDAADEILEEYAMQEIHSRLEQQEQDQQEQEQQEQEQQVQESGTVSGTQGNAEGRENGYAGEAVSQEEVKEVERITVDRIEVD